MTDHPPPDPGWSAPAAPPPGSAPSGWGAPPPPPVWGGAAPVGWGPSPGAGPGGWTPAAQPGVVPLRPLGLGELLDGAVRTMRQNPRVMFGVSAVVMAIATALSTVLLLLGLGGLRQAMTGAEDGLSSAEVAQLASSGLVGSLLPLLLQTLATIVLTGILILAVSEAVLGRTPSSREVMRRVGSRIWALLGLSVLTAVIYLALLVALLAPGVALLAAHLDTAGAVVLALGVLALLVLAPFLWVRLSFAGPSLLLERVGIGRAIGRSWRLTVGSWWRVFGILLLTSVIAAVAGGVLSAPFALVGAVVGSAVGGGSAEHGAAFAVAQVIANLGRVLATTVTAPFSAAVVALLYIDLRIRREGLDVALARAATEQAAPTR